MKGYRLAALSAALLLTTSLWGCSLFPEEEEALAPPLTAPASVTYTTTTVERGTIIDSVTVSGVFVSTTSYDLSFEKRAGYLSEITVKAGDYVTEGQLLARLDTDALEKELKKQQLVVERAQIALKAAKASESATQDSIRLAEIDYQLQALQLSELQDEIGKQSIYAPADGVVSYLGKQSVGEYVAARSTMVRIVDPTSLQVECTGDKISDFQLDQEVVVTYNKKQYAGKVVVTPASAPLEMAAEGKTYIRIEITDPLPEGEEMLGKSVSVELIREKKEDVIVIPRNVVSMYSGEAYVQVLENGVKKERIIETGIKNVTSIEVISGLEEGEEVIIK
ncbi:MAG: efflux RND transporter periplasmic adaptor subunit [Oscillospiraceae bacterium]|nr:efflux RND transporter periplasmic adaptor subunit [Oscillospiraceae bacterium]